MRLPLHGSGFFRWWLIGCLLSCGCAWSCRHISIFQLFFHENTILHESSWDLLLFLLLLLLTALLRECCWNVGRKLEVNDGRMKCGHCHACELSVEVDWNKCGLTSKWLVYLKELGLHAFEFVWVSICDLFFHYFGWVGAQGEIVLRWLSVVKLDS